MNARIITMLLVLALAGSAGATRVKDIARLAGVRGNQLQGYGLVVGLHGTGDSSRSLFTNQSLAGLLARAGIKVSAEDMRTKNVAAVIITATLPPFATPGTEIDVVVSSIGDAKSLRGGSLLMAPLFGVDRQIYAMAAGPLTVGGFSASGAGSRVTKNHPTVGRVPGGATIERALGVDLSGRSELVYVLHQPDFTTAANVARAITDAGAQARALDARRVVVDVPEDRRTAPVELIATIEAANVKTDTSARVVLNARTGTVVMGSHVRISEVALAHGGLQVEVRSLNQVSQPAPLSTGTTAGVRNAQVQAIEGAGAVNLLKETATLDQLVKALNTLGVTPSDLIDILQAMRSAGALQAEIVVQ